MLDFSKGIRLIPDLTSSYLFAPSLLKWPLHFHNHLFREKDIHPRHFREEMHMAVVRCQPRWPENKEDYTRILLVSCSLPQVPLGGPQNAQSYFGILQYQSYSSYPPIYFPQKTVLWGKCCEPSYFQSLFQASFDLNLSR
jgi:hypothetical protein